MIHDDVDEMTSDQILALSLRELEQMGLADITLVMERHPDNPWVVCLASAVTAALAILKIVGGSPHTPEALAIHQTRMLHLLLRKLQAADAARARAAQAQAN